MTQLPIDTITLNVESDSAGCLRTRSSRTGFAACHGQHVIKAASTSQTVIALSSGESECLGDCAWPEMTDIVSSLFANLRNKH